MLLKPVTWLTHRDGVGRMVVVADEGGAASPGYRATHLLGTRLGAARSRARSSDAGDRVTPSVDGFPPFRAVVAWTAKEEVGLEFERPLHPLMVHHSGRSTRQAE